MLFVQVAKVLISRLLAPKGVYLNITKWIPEMRRVLTGTGRHCTMAVVEYTHVRQTSRGRATNKKQAYCVFLDTLCKQTFALLRDTQLEMRPYKLQFQDMKKVAASSVHPGASFYGSPH